MGWEELDDIMADDLRGDESFDADGFGDGSVMSTEDGCVVEPDGKCPHGYESPAIRLLGL